MCTERGMLALAPALHRDWAFATLYLHTVSYLVLLNHCQTCMMFVRRALPEQRLKLLFARDWHRHVLRCREKLWTAHAQWA